MPAPVSDAGTSLARIFEAAASGGGATEARSSIVLDPGGLIFPPSRPAGSSPPEASPPPADSRDASAGGRPPASAPAAGNPPMLPHREALCGQARDGAVRGGEARSGEVRVGEVQHREEQHGAAWYGEVRNGETRGGEAPDGKVRHGDLLAPPGPMLADSMGHLPAPPETVPMGSAGGLPTPLEALGVNSSSEQLIPPQPVHADSSCEVVASPLLMHTDSVGGLVPPPPVHMDSLKDLDEMFAVAARSLATWPAVEDTCGRPSADVSSGAAEYTTSAEPRCGGLEYQAESTASLSHAECRTDTEPSCGAAENKTDADASPCGSEYKMKSEPSCGGDAYAPVGSRPLAQPWYALAGAAMAGASAHACAPPGGKDTAGGLGDAGLSAGGLNGAPLNGGGSAWGEMRCPAAPEGASGSSGLSCSVCNPTEKAGSALGSGTAGEVREHGGGRSEARGGEAEEIDAAGGEAGAGCCASVCGHGSSNARPGGDMASALPPAQGARPASLLGAGVAGLLGGAAAQSAAARVATRVAGLRGYFSGGGESFFGGGGQDGFSFGSGEEESRGPKLGAPEVSETGLGTPLVGPAELRVLECASATLAAERANGSDARAVGMTAGAGAGMHAVTGLARATEALRETEPHVTCKQANGGFAGEAVGLSAQETTGGHVVDAGGAGARETQTNGARVGFAVRHRVGSCCTSQPPEEPTAGPSSCSTRDGRGIPDAIAPWSDTAGAPTAAPTHPTLPTPATVTSRVAAGFGASAVSTSESDQIRALRQALQASERRAALLEQQQQQGSTQLSSHSSAWPVTPGTAPPTLRPDELSISGKGQTRRDALCGLPTSEQGALGSGAAGGRCAEGGNDAVGGSGEGGESGAGDEIGAGSGSGARGGSSVASRNGAEGGNGVECGSSSTSGSGSSLDDFESRLLAVCAAVEAHVTMAQGWAAERDRLLARCEQADSCARRALALLHATRAVATAIAEEAAARQQGNPSSPGTLACKAFGGLYVGGKGGMPARSGAGAGHSAAWGGQTAYGTPPPTVVARPSSAEMPEWLKGAEAALHRPREVGSVATPAHRHTASRASRTPFTAGTGAWFTPAPAVSSRDDTERRQLIEIGRARFTQLRSRREQGDETLSQAAISVAEGTPPAQLNLLS